MKKKKAFIVWWPANIPVACTNRTLTDSTWICFCVCMGFVVMLCNWVAPPAAAADGVSLHPVKWLVALSMECQLQIDRDISFFFSRLDRRDR